MTQETKYPKDWPEALIYNLAKDKKVLDELDNAQEILGVKSIKDNI